MKISLIITVFNEEKTISALFDSLLKQTKTPDEIVIVDGGSSDRTVAKIENEKLKIKKYNVKLKMFVKPKSTIAQARNYGIRHAIGSIVAMTDGGCVAHRDWLEKITRPFEKENADIVAGFYRMTGSTPLQKVLGVYLGIPPQRFDPDRFLPSCRSMAFKKSLWQKIGGFKESLDKGGEDTLFNYQAIKLGARFVRVKNALVDWEMPKSLWEGVKKFYIYAKGDVQANIWWHPTQRVSTHNLKILSIFIRYTFGATLLILSFYYPFLLYVVVMGGVFYLLWSAWKIKDVTKDAKVVAWGALLQVLSDIAVITGAIVGLARKELVFSSKTWDIQKK